MDVNEVKEPEVEVTNDEEKVTIDPEKIIVVASESEEANSILPDPTLKRYYENLNNRIIWITDEIDERVYSIITQILNFNREDKDIEYDNRKPIRLIISSPGGDLDYARALVSIMGMSNTPIITVAIGCVASAASLIYLAGHLRYAVDFAYFVFHKGGIEGLSGSFVEVTPYMKHYVQDIQEVIDFYKRFTTYDPDYIEQKLAAGDWYIRLDEAIENGVVDQLIDNVDELI